MRRRQVALWTTGLCLAALITTMVATPARADQATTNPVSINEQSSGGHWVAYDGTLLPAVDIQPQQQVPCPPGTTNYTGPAQPYSCVRVFVDSTKHQVGLRQGRSGPENSAFGLLHMQIDHGLSEHQAELLIQDTAGILQAGTRFRYGMTFRVAGDSLVSLEFIEDRAPSKSSPDKDALGIVTGYCRGGDQNAPIENHCPPLPPPFDH